MAGRNANTFLKRQKEMDRTRKAREKMARRHGRRAREAAAVDAAPPAETGAEVMAAGAVPGTEGDAR